MFAALLLGKGDGSDFAHFGLGWFFYVFSLK
jgi:hypothetical protein